MIAAKEFPTEQIQRAYNRRSWVYSKTVAAMELSYHAEALEQAKVKPGEKVLEVAVGPGLTLVKLAQLVGHDQTIYGVDLSTSMLEMTRKRLLDNGFTDFELKIADSRSLPFEDNSFDLLYNAYMLDLIPERDMPQIISEFKRVLRKGGRLVLLNMSKPDASPIMREWLYRYLPATLVLYVMGACRPVLMEDITRASGFGNVLRIYLAGKAPSEIVMGVKQY